MDKFNRIQSVDVFRLVAIIAVILLHTQPFGDNSFQEKSLFFAYIHTIIFNLALFAIPFFFVISGYFWGIKVRSGLSIDLTSTKMIKRLLLIFLVWSFIYLFPHDITSIKNAINQYGIFGPIMVSYRSLRNQLVFSPITLLFRGTKDHLWFLMALTCAVTITYFCVKRGIIKSLVAVALILYIINLLATPYSRTPIGINITFNTRYGPFFGTIFFVSDYLLSNYKPTYKWLYIGLYIFSAGVIMHFLEAYYLWKVYGVMPYNYLLGTYLIGLGISILSLSNHKLIKCNRLATIGQLTLGIYLIHFLFVDLLRPIGKIFLHSVWEIGYPIIVLCLSLASVSFLSKHKYTKGITS